MNIVTLFEQYNKLTQELDYEKVYFILRNENRVPTVFEGTVSDILFHIKDQTIEFNISFWDNGKNLFLRRTIDSIGEDVFFSKQLAENVVNLLNVNKNFDDGTFRITKNKPYRVNFSYQDKHYSIQIMGELYEEYVGLSCKEDPSFFVTLPITPSSVSCLIPPMSHGQTYRDTDLSGIKGIITDYIIPREMELGDESKDDCIEER